MQRTLPDISRRNFLACGAAAAVAPGLASAAGMKTLVWVQLTTGGRPYRASFQAMFLDPMFIETEVWPIDHPTPFSALVPGPTGAGSRTSALPPAAPVGRGAVGGAPTLRDEPADYPWEPSGGRPHPGYDVLVLNDQVEWPEDARQTVRQAVDLGRGFVLIHNSLGDNQTWPWWYQEVTGGLLVLSDRDGMKKSSTTTSSSLEVRPVGKHPILRDIAPFRLVNEESYRGMWQSPKITPLLQTDSSASDKTLAWIGHHPKARVVCIQPGEAPETHRHPMFRRLVRNSILWAAGRLG
jgi:hypothetical protein